jgi:hypothetical protein
MSKSWRRGVVVTTSPSNNEQVARFLFITEDGIKATPQIFSLATSYW